MPDKNLDPDIAEPRADSEQHPKLTEPDQPATPAEEEMAVEQPELFGPPAGRRDPNPPAPSERLREFAPRAGMPEFAPPPPVQPTPAPTSHGSPLDAAPTPSASEALSSASEPAAAAAEPPGGTRPMPPPPYSPPRAVVPPPAVLTPPTPTYSPPPGRPATPFGSATTGASSVDVVTLLEVAAPDEGGVRETVLAANRSDSPPSPEPAKRTGRGHPVLRIVSYALVVIALTLVFVVVLSKVFHLG